MAFGGNPKGYLPFRGILKDPRLYKKLLMIPGVWSNPKGFFIFRRNPKEIMPLGRFLKQVCLLRKS
jgi:hypothetical protein